MNMVDTRPLVPRRSPLRGVNDSPRNSGPSAFSPRHHPTRQMSIDSSQSFAWSGASELSASTTASSFHGQHKISPWASPIDSGRPSMEMDLDIREEGEWRGLPDSPDVAEDIDAHLDRLSDFFPSGERAGWSASEAQERIHTDRRPETAGEIEDLMLGGGHAVAPIGRRPRFSWLDLPAEPASRDEETIQPAMDDGRRESAASNQLGFVLSSALPTPVDASPALTLRPSSSGHLAPSTAEASHLARQAVAHASKLSQDRRNSPLPPQSYFDLPISSSPVSTPGATSLKPPASPTHTLGVASRRESMGSVYSNASYATTSAHAPARLLEPVPAVPSLDKRSSWWSDMLSVPASPAQASPTKSIYRAGAGGKIGGRRRSRISMQRASIQRNSYCAPPSPRSPRTPIPRFVLPDSPRDAEEGVGSALGRLSGIAEMRVGGEEDGASLNTPSLDRSLPSLPSSTRPSPRSSTASPARASKRNSRSSVILANATKRLSIAPSLPADLVPTPSAKRESIVGLGGIEKKQLPRRPRPRLGRRILQALFNGGFFASHQRTWDIVVEEEVVVVEPKKPRQPRISRITPVATPPATAYKRISTPLDDPNQRTLYEMYSREGQKKRAEEEDEKPLAALSPHGVRAPLMADSLSKQLSTRGSPGSASSIGPRSAMSPSGFPFAGSYISTGGAKSTVSGRTPTSAMGIVSPGAPGLPPMPFPFGAAVPPSMLGIMPLPTSMPGYAPLRSDMTIGNRAGPASTMSTRQPTRQQPSSTLSVPATPRRSPKTSPLHLASPPAVNASRASMSSRPHRGVNPELKIDTARAAAQQRARMAAAEREVAAAAALRRSQAAHPATVTPKTPKVVHAATRSAESHKSLAATVVEEGQEIHKEATAAGALAEPKSAKWSAFFKRSKSVSAKEGTKLNRKQAEARVSQAMKR